MESQSEPQSEPDGVIRCAETWVSELTELDVDTHGKQLQPETFEDPIASNKLGLWTQAHFDEVPLSEARACLRRLRRFFDEAASDPITTARQLQCLSGAREASGGTCTEA